jgi:subtilisin family serine protease
VTTADPIRGRRARTPGISIGLIEADLLRMGLFDRIRRSLIPGTSDLHRAGSHRPLLLVRSPFSVLLAVCALVAVAAPAALAHAVQPNHVVVAIIDTGVSPTKQLTPRLLPGWDFVDNDANATDENGHGTELASIIVAQCPRCSIMPVRVLGRSGLGSATLAIAGIQWAVAHNADVINLSMTTPSDNPDLTAAVEAAVATGITVVVAAGNSGLPMGYPAATATDAIAVASVNPAGQLYSWSNFGPWVDVKAPGTLLAKTVTGHTVSATGTSASAAYVTGTAGRLLGCEPALTPAEVSTQLGASLVVNAC